jgi:hypothetical protein
MGKPTPVPFTHAEALDMLSLAQQVSEQTGDWRYAIEEVIAYAERLVSDLDPEQNGVAVLQYDSTIIGNALINTANEWGANPEPWGDSDKDYRNELRDRGRVLLTERLADWEIEAMGL